MNLTKIPQHCSHFGITIFEQEEEQCCQIKFLNIHENFSEMFTKSSRTQN